MFLDMPLRMAGQPNIYKMPKEILVGCKPLLKKAPYSWWPLKEHEVYNVGQFDIYPIQFSEENVQTLIGGQCQESSTTEQISSGTHLIRGLYSLKLQQLVADEIREMCAAKPKEFRFARCVPPLAKKLGEHDDDFEKRQLMYVDKQDCYSLSIAARDAPGVIQSSAFAMEEAFASTENKHSKLKDTKSFVADFYKPEGYMSELTAL